MPFITKKAVMIKINAALIVRFICASFHYKSFKTVFKLIISHDRGFFPALSCPYPPNSAIKCTLHKKQAAIPFGIAA
jgi:hypothetical protein